MPELFDPDPMVGKSQDVRIWDLVVLGPFMLWAALKRGPLPEWARTVMVVSALATIFYNGYNYWRQERATHG